MAYGASISDLYRRAAAYVDKIPQEVPVPRSSPTIAPERVSPWLCRGGKLPELRRFVLFNTIKGT